jgi:hypothetical protein
VYIIDRYTYTKRFEVPAVPQACTSLTGTPILSALRFLQFRFRFHNTSCILFCAGVYIIDRYTYYALEFLERVNPGDSPQRTMAEFMAVCPRQVSILNSVFGSGFNQGRGFVSGSGFGIWFRI